MREALWNLSCFLRPLYLNIDWGVVLQIVHFELLCWAGSVEVGRVGFEPRWVHILECRSDDHRFFVDCLPPLYP